MPRWGELWPCDLVRAVHHGDAACMTGLATAPLRQGARLEIEVAAQAGAPATPLGHPSLPAGPRRHRMRWALVPSA